MTYEYKWIDRWDELVKSAESYEEIENSVKDLRAVTGNSVYLFFTSQDFSLTPPMILEIEEIINSFKKSFIAFEQAESQISTPTIRRRVQRIFQNIPTRAKQFFWLFGAFFLAMLTITGIIYTWQGAPTPTPTDLPPIPVMIVGVIWELYGFFLLFWGSRNTSTLKRLMQKALANYAEELGREVDGRIIEQKIIPIMRQLINKEIIRLNKDKSTILKVNDAPGLWRNLEPHQEIATVTLEKVRWLLERFKSGSGSIGIAGPRGIGKTTLLNSLYRTQNINNQKLLIGMPVPVRFDAHEFILNLFKRVCEEFLKLEGEVEQEIAPVNEKLLLRKIQDYIKALSPLLTYLITIGILGILISVGLALNTEKIQTALFVEPFSTSLQNLFNFKSWLVETMGANPKDLFRLSVLVLLIPTTVLLPILGSSIASWSGWSDIFPSFIRRNTENATQNNLPSDRKKVELIFKAKYYLQAIKSPLQKPF